MGETLFEYVPGFSSNPYASQGNGNPRRYRSLITPTHVLGVHRQLNFILADFEGSHPEELKAQAFQNWATDMLAPLGAPVEV